MAKNYWMVVQSPDDFRISKQMGFTVHGLGRKYRRRADRMEPDDPVLFYVSGIRKWAAIASIRSRKFEDHTPIWKSQRQDNLPYRVKLAPKMVLEEADYIDAGEVGPRLEYLKRWPPERWPLAFFDSLHLLPQRDFRLIESEMKRVMSRRRGRRGRRRNDWGGDRRPQRSEATQLAASTSAAAEPIAAPAEPPSAQAEPPSPPSEPTAAQAEPPSPPNEPTSAPAQPPSAPAESTAAQAEPPSPPNEPPSPHENRDAAAS